MSGIGLYDQYRMVTLADGRELTRTAFLIVSGATFRHSDVPGVKELTVASVFYGTAYTETCLSINETVFVIDGANPAGRDATYLRLYCHATLRFIGEGGRYRLIAVRL